MAAAAPLSAERLGQEAAALAGAVQGSLGPRGGHVLLARPTGEVLLARDGGRVLQALRLESPTARAMVACASAHQAATGDGAKTFIIFLSSLLQGLQVALSKGVAAMASPVPRRGQREKSCMGRKEIAQSLMAFQTQVLDQVVTRDLGKHFLSAFPHRTTEMERPMLESIFEAYLCGRIGRNHLKFLSQLGCDYYYLCTSCETVSNETLNFLNDCFMALHTAVTGLPVSSSRVLDGLVLQRDFVAYCPADGDIRTLIVTDAILPALSASGVEFIVNTQVQYQASQAWISKRTEAVMKYLQRHKVKVLLSSVKQEEMVIFYAKLCGISVVQCLSPEEVSLLCKITGISPFRYWDNIHSEITEIATATFCRPILLGSKRYVHLGFSGTSAFQPHCVILCGPVHGVTEQHVSAFRGAFKMLQLLFKTVDQTDGFKEKTERPNKFSDALRCSSHSTTPQKLKMEDVTHRSDKTTDQQLNVIRSKRESQLTDSAMGTGENPAFVQKDLQKSLNLAVPITEIENDKFSGLTNKSPFLGETENLHLKYKHPSEIQVKGESKPVVSNQHICKAATTVAGNTSTELVPGHLSTIKDRWKDSSELVPFEDENSYKSSVQNYSDLFIQAGSVLPVGGNFEILLHYYLCNYTKQCQQSKISIISTIIADALLSIPEILYRTEKGSGFPKFYLEAISALRNNQPLPRPQKGLESVYCKYLLVVSVLHCVTKLLSVDSIIGIKRLPQVTEDNDSEEDL
ncbi:PREDICTED: Bardet-Biedl syndrome 10 protein [Crocodylus porosus]|nr:PREDICTED: Bardet-Biedl syndrome 10 protein [Crocodylus porosus]